MSHVLPLIKPQTPEWAIACDDLFAVKLELFQKVARDC